MSSGAEPGTARKARRARVSATPYGDVYAAQGEVTPAARAMGLSRSVFHRRLQAERASAPVSSKAKPKSAKAVADGGSGLASAIASLADAQAAQGKLFERLLARGEPSRVSKAKCDADEKPSTPAKSAKPEKPLVGGTIEAPEMKEVRAVGRRFFLTTAQNNSHVHPVLAVAQRWAAENQGEVLVARISYNAAAYGQPHEVVVEEGDGDPEDGGQWYAPELADLIVRAPMRLADDLLFTVGMNISPSAVDPLSGLESYTRSSSGIFPHTKHEMRSMASMKGVPARMLYTTGACTLANYIPRKAGQKAEHHHVYGGLIVEVDEDDAWFVRQVNASADGSFHDLDRLWTVDGSVPSVTAGLTPGDIHRRKMTEAGIADAIWGDGGMVDVLRPGAQLVNDLTDFSPRNHHNIRSAWFLARQRTRRQDSVEDEMAECADFLRRASRPWCEVVVVESNHDEAFARWLEEADGHRDPDNARYWHQWNARVFEGIERGEEVFPFEAAVREKAPGLERVRFLREDDSYVLCPEHGGVECGMHGHRGPNGSRGSTKGYRVLGVRTITGHTHTAGIWGGQFSAGVTGDLDMDYNRGPSSWSHSHVVTYPNAKRAVVTMRGTRWRGQPLPKPRIRVKAATVAAPSAAAA